MSYRPRSPLPELPSSVADAPFRAPIDSSRWECEHDGCGRRVAWLVFNPAIDEVEAWCKEHTPLSVDIVN
jgi:hypothetical protein